MAVRKSAIRRLRRELISRTARIWSRLNRSLIHDLGEITQSWLKKLIKQAENDIASGDILNVPDLPMKFTKILQRYLREALAYGYWLNYLYVHEVSGRKYRGKITLAEGDDIRELLENFIVSNEWNDVIPEDAVNWINDYVPKLAEVFHNDVLEKTRDVIRQSLINGLTLQERVKALREAASKLSSMSQHRLEAIARTEITRADTMGRLVSMKANNDVIGVEFSAIMDDRTTDICVARHGLVMRLDDPRLAENTPPLHVNCRSMLLSLTIYDYPDGLLTSHEFDNVMPGIQRAEDVEEARKILQSSTDKTSFMRAKFNELQNQAIQYEQEYDNLERLMQAAVGARDIITYNTLLKRQQNISKLMQDTNNLIRELKINLAEDGIILASGLEKKLDKTDIDAIVELVKNASPDVRKCWNIFEENMKIADTHVNKGAYYDSNNRSVYFDIREDRYSTPRPHYSVLFHELGHLIDHAAHSYFLSRVEEEHDLYNTLKSEVDDYVNAMLKKLKNQAITDGKDVKSIKKGDAYKSIQRELFKLPESARVGISDVFSGVTLNKVKDGGYHPTTYWKEHSHYVCLEFFAETYSSSIVNPEAIEILKRYVPKSYEIFGTILKKIIKGA